MTALSSFDIDGDGVKEVIAGWSNGSFSIRRDGTGELLYRDSPATSCPPVVSIVCADYRLDGNECLMVCLQSGEVKGFLATDSDLSATVSQASTTKNTGINSKNAGDQQVLADLQAKKLELMGELRLLEKAMKAKPGSEALLGSLPANTNLVYVLEPVLEAGCVQLSVDSTTDILLFNLVVIDTEGTVMAGHEIAIVSPFQPRRSAKISLRPTKNVPAQLKVQAHLSVRGYSSHLHVLEQTVQIPRFSRFCSLPEIKDRIPSSKVSFFINESIPRLHEWLKSCFILMQGSGGVKVSSDKEKLKANFVSVCSTGLGQNSHQQVLHIFACNPKAADSSSTRRSEVRIDISCESMELAGEVLQDICRFFRWGHFLSCNSFFSSVIHFHAFIPLFVLSSITELEAEADFPSEMKQFENLLSRVADLNADRMRLTADMAESSQKVKVSTALTWLSCEFY